MNPLLASPEIWARTLKKLSQQVQWPQVDVVIGIESRGFILGSALAALHNKGFVPCRKAGKLPPPVMTESYDLEYGSATLELQPNTNPDLGRALIVDDVLATGGTLRASLSLAQQAGFHVQEVLVLVNITGLNSFLFQDQPVKSLISI